MKVYCENCKHFCPRFCSGSLNMYVKEYCGIAIKKETYLSSEETVDYPLPRIKNQSNDCKDYERRLTLKEKFFNLFK